MHRLTPHYQIRVRREGQLDVISVQVEKSPDAAGANSADLARELKKGIKDYVGVSANIDVCEAGGVARSEGKAVRVVDERQD